VERQGKQSKLRALIKEAPAWISIVISLGTMIFALGVMYNNVQSLKDRMEKADQSSIQVIRMTGQINNLQTQIQNNYQTQQHTNESVDKLTDAVNTLSVSVSNLEGKLNIMPPPRRRK
jgi:methyl-accepting chemotaxis protein